MTWGETSAATLRPVVWINARRFIRLNCLPSTLAWQAVGVKQFDFPRWNQADIRALPETRIGDWAAKHGVEMDKLYATEEREAGTPALLDDVPGFKREDLSVFSMVEWESRRDEFVLESWLAKARAP